MASVREFPAPTIAFTGDVLRERFPATAPAAKIAKAMRAHKAGYKATKAQFASAHPECWRVEARYNNLHCAEVGDVSVFVDDSGAPGLYMVSDPRFIATQRIRTMLEQYGLWESVVLEAYAMPYARSVVAVLRLPTLNIS